MSTLSNKLHIKAQIALLKIERHEQLEEMKAAFQDTKDSLKPRNLIKRIFSNKSEGKSQVLEGLGSMLIGLASGYLVKKTLFSNSKGILMNLVSVLVQSFVTNTAANHSDEIKDKGGDILHTILDVAKGLIHKFKENRQERIEEEYLREEIIAQN